MPNSNKCKQTFDSHKGEHVSQVVQSTLYRLQVCNLKLEAFLLLGLMESITTNTHILNFL